MGIAAGVLLIMAAILNVFAAFAYNAKGKLNSGAANLGEKVVSELGDDSKGQFSDYQKTGMLNKAFALFLYVSVPTLVVGGVYAFNGNYTQILFAAGIVAIAAELIGGSMSKFGPSNLSGIAGGCIAVFLSYEQVLALLG
ncbi:Uncharacterised protein [BD1-7 clade bacterium]|uniref:Uncharacterized protein n=1 Tax=BD1-7 clade bacterium TaxID=2029982 RepID=A0A5S9NQE9_9GAMM|nr:Uncharacterised protein [BD1-7 clade bacterium]